MIVEVSENNFESEVINSNLPVVIDFWAEWCGPCRQISPILKDIASQRKDVKIVKINVDDNSELSVKFRVQSIPTLLFMKKGEVIDTKIGASSAVDLTSWIDKNLL